MRHSFKNAIPVYCFKAAYFMGVLFGGSLTSIAQQYSYQVYSQPAGLVATASNTVAVGTVVPIQYLPYGYTSGNYYFGYWTVNGVRLTAASGASFSPMNIAVTNNSVAVAVFVPGGDSSPGLPDSYQLFWFGNTNQSLASDPMGDGFSIADDLARDYCPDVANTTISGGGILRLSGSVTFVPTNTLYYYQITSQPQAIISPQSGYASSNTIVRTPSIPYGATGNYYFAYWTLNGVRQAGDTGVSLNTLTLTMTNDMTAVAIFFPSGDSVGSGLQDWYQWFWLGNLNLTAGSDPTGDGFAISDDIARDYSPVVANLTANGGAIMRVSASTAYSPAPYLLPPYYQNIAISILHGQITLAWSAYGILQSATNVNGPYADVAVATNYYVFTPIADHLFFRAKFP